MNLQIHGERCSRCIKSWRSGFARFFLFSFLLLFFLFLSTINRPFDFHGNERFPSKYRIDRRPTKREKERERTDIFAGNNGNDFCDRKRNLSRADISFFYEFDFHHHRETSIVSPTTDFLRIIPRDCGQPLWWQPATSLSEVRLLSEME